MHAIGLDPAVLAGLGPMTAVPIEVTPAAPMPVPPVRAGAPDPIPPPAEPWPVWAAVTLEPEVVVDLTEPSTAIVLEAARTDAAFDVWMAVAPTRTTTPVSTPPLPPPPESAPAVRLLAPTRWDRVAAAPEDRASARWVRPLEVLAALIGAAAIVVLVLLLVG